MSHQTVAEIGLSNHVLQIGYQWSGNNSSEATHVIAIRLAPRHRRSETDTSCARALPPVRHEIERDAS